MKHVSSPMNLSAVLGAAVLALSGCSGGSGSHDAASSGAAPSSGTSAASSAASSPSSTSTPPQHPESVTRFGDALRITDNGISPEELQKDVTTPVTKAAADAYVASVKPDEAWAKQLASRYGQGAKPSTTMNDQKKNLDSAVQEAAKQRVFPERCTDMWHLTNAVSRPSGSTFASLHTADDKVSVVYAKLAKNTMPLGDVFVDFMTCTRIRIASGDGRSIQASYQTLPLKDAQGTVAYTVRMPELDGYSTYLDVTERNGVRMTAISLEKDGTRKQVEDALEHGSDLLPTTPAPGILAAPHKKMFDFTDIDNLSAKHLRFDGPGQPLTFQPRYSETWTKNLLSSMGQVTPRIQPLAQQEMIPVMEPYVTAEYNRSAEQQECLPSADLGYVSFGGGMSAQRSLTPKTAWFVDDKWTKMASLVEMKPGAKGHPEEAPMSLEDAFAKASKCTSVTFRTFDDKPYTVGYEFNSFKTSSGQKAYTRKIISNDEILPFQYVAMTDVGNVRVTVWSNSDKDIKSDLEKAMKAAKQQPKS